VRNYPIAYAPDEKPRLNTSVEEHVPQVSNASLFDGGIPNSLLPHVSKFPRCVSGLEVLVAPGPLTIKAGGSSYASIACYPAKIPHFFETLKILAFYAILLCTPLIACESFMEALLSGFQRFVCRLALPSNRWLKRPTPGVCARVPSNV
jgi:hypothetical protein